MRESFSFRQEMSFNSLLFVYIAQFCLVCFRLTQLSKNQNKFQRVINQIFPEFVLRLILAVVEYFLFKYIYFMFSLYFALILSQQLSIVSILFQIQLITGNFQIPLLFVYTLKLSLFSFALTLLFKNQNNFSK